jgi:hypothetical protein
MRTFCRIALTLGLAALLAVPALAQQRQRGQGQGGIGSLLANESVQKELKIEKDQADKVKEAVAKVTDKFKDDVAKIADLPQDERGAKRTALNKTITEETYKSIEDVLKPDQIKRLKQIELQQAAISGRAFTREDVVTALKLTDEQKEKIKTINADSAKELTDLRANGGNRTNREKIAAVQKETGEKLQGVLTDDQKKTWKEMTGEAFTLVRPQRQPNTNPPLNS